MPPQARCGMDYTNSQMTALIDEHIHSERDRGILKRRLIDGTCYEPLSEEYGLSVVQVKRIVYRERGRLFELIQK